MTRNPRSQIPRVKSALFISPVAEAGGSDHALLRLIRQLAGDGYRCHVAVPGPSPLETEFAEAGARTHVVPMRRITTAAGVSWWLRYAFEWPRAVLRLRKLARDHDVDVVASNSLHSWYGWAVAASIKRPHVWHAREIVMQSRAALWLERRLVARYANILIACSHAVADQFRDVLSRERLCVVHDDVDRTTFRPGPAATLRERLGLIDDQPVVGFVGRVDTWKGVDVLLDAWPAVLRTEPSAQLLIVGPAVTAKEDYYAKQRSRTTQWDGVEWLGPLDPTATAEVYQVLDVLAAPSTLPEPYGLVLVEALASGGRVVATNMGGAPEIVAMALPGAGLLIEPRDAPSLSNAILRLLAVARHATREPLIQPFPFDWTALYDQVIDSGSDR